MIETFFKLLIGHAVADFWAQSAEMRHAKGWKNAVEANGVKIWPYALTAHALIHAGAVWIITGNPWLGAAEFFWHWMIDYGRCSHWYHTHVDQSLHVGCKVMWTVLA